MSSNELDLHAGPINAGMWFMTNPYGFTELEIILRTLQEWTIHIGFGQVQTSFLKYLLCLGQVC